MWMILEAEALGRREVINDGPVSLANARRVLWSMATKLEKMPDVTGIETDYWISPTGGIFEGIRFEVVHSNGETGCQYAAFLTDCPDLALEQDQWIPG
jgi:hypothetical protein